jgi:hypothetical protein
VECMHALQHFLLFSFSFLYLVRPSFFLHPSKNPYSWRPWRLWSKTLSLKREKGIRKTEKNIHVEHVLDPTIFTPCKWISSDLFSFMIPFSTSHWFPLQFASLRSIAAALAKTKQKGPLPRSTRYLPVLLFHEEKVPLPGLELDASLCQRIHALFLWAVLFAGSAMRKQWDKIEFFSPVSFRKNRTENERKPRWFFWVRPWPWYDAAMA